MPRHEAYPVDEARASRRSKSPSKEAAVQPLPPPHKKAAHSWLFWWPDGVGGISSQGLFGTLAPWVDVKKRPGHTSQAELLSFKSTAWSVVTGRFFFMAPHSTWAAMALMMYIVAPYEDAIDEARQGWAIGWAARRFALNLIVALGYYGFFHIGLWHLKWGRRKYLPDVYPTLGNMAHNLYYWLLGIVQWTCWECVMIRLWATGKVPYTTNHELLSDWRVLALNVFAVLLTPCWRDTHFYIVHRFSHLRGFYKYVHSLHHRNVDPEPFSGLCMHPIEHLYYYSNAWTPALYMTLSPFVFLYTFVHLTIAPGAGHSGWEDHFQSDQYHYLHHAKFECNYGSPFSASIDMALGTFREALGASNHYSGEWSEGAAAAAAAAQEKQEAAAAAKPRRVWSQHSYLGLPATRADGLYTLFWVALFPLCYWAAVLNHEVEEPATIWSRGQAASLRVETILGVPTPELVATVVGIAPVVLAVALAKLTGDRMSWRWPFHKERLVGTLGLFLLLGWLAVLLPTYHAVKMMSEPAPAR